ncbi:MAG: glycosyltransferase family 1 protein, partial [Chloroflexi bacterium]|nr:glycosyltransferase family 1 protein [Chloroflexota bacterium]
MASHGADIGLLTYGTRGDVEPFLALAAALQCAGLRPRLAAPGTYASLAAAHRIPFRPLPGDLPALAHDMVTRAGTNSLRTVLAVSRFIEPLAVEAFRSMHAWSAGADLIVHSFLTTRAGFELARERGIPSLSAQFFPAFAPTAAFPAPIFPDLPLGNFYRRLTHEIVAQIFRRGGDMIYRRVRRVDPSLPSLGPWPFQAEPASRPLILFAFSRHVIPAAPEWSGIADVTGYWLPGIPPGWTPPPELERFLDGEAPVYIGLGSGSAAGRGAWISAAVAALQRVGARGVLDLGGGDPAELRLPPSILAVRDLPHAWLFPRMAAVVHHGGAGTTGAGLTAGKPTVVIPTSSDQPFWGRRVHALGVGPAPIPIRRLNAETLTRALATVLRDTGVRARAIELGEQLH